MEHEYDRLTAIAVKYLDAFYTHFKLESDNEEAIRMLKFNLKMLGYDTELDTEDGKFVLKVSY